MIPQPCHRFGAIAQNRPARWLPAILAMALALGTGAAAANPAPAADPAAICEIAAQRAAAATGVPIEVLAAISLNETGKKQAGRFRPWPWTVNMEGKGVWFDDRQKALDYAVTNFDRGARSFDVGCFQLNYRWHGHAFRSIEEMFDPEINALYAARYLTDLYREKGNWIDAAGAYHSRTPLYADKYKARFARFLAGMGADFPAPPATTAPAEPQLAANLPPAPRVNTFILLKGESQSATAFGSLFPRLDESRANPFLGG